jgi:hypothetical protein
LHLAAAFFVLQPFFNTGENMIEFTYRELKRFLLAYRLILATSRRFNPPHVNIESDTRGVRLTSASSQFLVRQEMGSRDDGRPLVRFAVEHQVLLQISAHNDQPIQMGVLDDSLTICWEEKGVPQQLTTTALEYDATPSSHQSLQIEPTPAVDAYRCTHQFLQALRDAYQTIDREGTGRYALNAIMLDGETGSMAATDGRHALIQRGFPWPWSDKQLIPVCKLFDSVAWIKLAEKERWQIRVWQQEKSIWMEFGTILLGLATVDGRFPNMEMLRTDESQAETTFEIDEVDASFLSEKIDCLPSGDKELSPVTVLLNGTVSIRGESGEQQPGVELVLSNSHKSGVNNQVSTNRSYLARAVSCGFRRISVSSSQSMAFSHDATRTYTWGLLMTNKKDEPSATEPTQIRSPQRGKYQVA